MKPYYKPLKEIDDKTKFYKCKVKVVHKGRPQQPPNKARYQRLILKDDQEFTMKATLFGSDIDAYAEALQRNGHYEISNAIIKPVPPQHASRENEFTMTINKKAEITPLAIDRNLLGPQYQTILSVPQNSPKDDLFDILGIIIHITEPKQIKQVNREPDHVTEVYITDQSCDRPYMISFWNQLAKMPDSLLNSWNHKFLIVGFHALKIKSYKGFTFTSSISTEMILEPVGPQAEELRNWALQNSTLLLLQRTKLAQMLSSKSDTQITTIQEIRKKMAHDTWQEERFILKARMPIVSADNFKMYLGCGNCGKSMSIENGTTTCCVQCLATNVNCIPRATMKTDIVDDTGGLELMFFSKEVEIISGCSCTELWTIKDDLEAFAAKVSEIRNSKFRIEIGPTIGLSKSRILSWAVRSIAIDSADL